MQNITAHFFLIVPLHLEELALQELELKFPHLFPLEHKIIPGGIELFNLNLDEGFTLNHQLKIPVRILLRLETFRCRDFPRLFQKLKKMVWKNYLYADDLQKFELKFSVQESRLNDSRKVEKALHEAITESFRHQSPMSGKSPTPPIIFIRLQGDDCTVSLDTSGDPLYKRHYRESPSLAPLRENLASALIFLSVKKLIEAKIPVPTLFINPMMGQGTLLFEALTLNTPLTLRSYAYQTIPMFKKRALTKKIVPVELSSPFQRFMGLELDPETFKLSEQNAQQFNLQGLQFKLEKGDLFDNARLPLHEAALVIINPPYGKRITLGDQPPKEYYQQLISKLQKLYPKAMIGLLIPRSVANTLRIQPPWVLLLQQKIFHGGIDLAFHLMQKRDV